MLNVKNNKSELEELKSKKYVFLGTFFEHNNTILSYFHIFLKIHTIKGEMLSTTQKKKVMGNTS